jgi:hypothetical protein
VFDIPEWFRKEGSVVIGAPRLFAISVLIAATIVGSGIYWFVDHLYSAQLQNKDATIETVEVDRNSYKEHWDESQQEINKLRAAIPSGYVTQIISTVSSVTNVQIFTQLVSSVGPMEETRYCYESVPNIIDGRQIVLQNEPIPQTVKIWITIGMPRAIALNNNALLEGKIITLTNFNNNQVKMIRDHFPTNSLFVEYIKRLSIQKAQ